MTDTSPISFTSSNRGKRLLVYYGYIYRLKKSTTKIKYWSCNSNGCTANVHTNPNDHFIKASGDHHHLPSPEQIELRNLMKKVKDRVQVETTSVPKIYEEELARSNLSSVALTLASIPAEAKSGLSRVRRKTTPPLPTSGNFDIPDVYRQTLNGEPFICNDKTTNKKRILIFATDKQLEILFSSEWIFLDGTFDACPKEFKQIYTIHGLKFYQNFPCAISLLSGKTTDTYRQLFHELEYHAERLKLKFLPVHIMSDFETSLIKVVKEKSLYKQIQSLGLVTAYFNDEDIRLGCRSTMALAPLPADYVEEAFELLEDDSPEDMAEFFLYFWKQWLKRVPKKYWNVLTLEFRTNNFTEGWHNKFNNRGQKHHPNIWHLIECLQREELSFRHKLGRLKCGFQKKSDDKSCTTRQQIQKMAKNYEEEESTLMEFLHGLSTLIAKNSKTVA
ncbi:unnamed protein product [Rotaria sordida]|uniref:FLYWCH-type domain-containing protein n=1 Tax=Rotaria sordida TaxID=392033 RepID=A0A815RAN7_9BILA|nr:unnamed protein product [Rotaria sordida]